MPRVSLADGVGAVAALTAVVWLPGAGDPLTYPKLLVLAGGGLLLLPFALHYWWRARRSAGPVVIVAAAAALLGLWGLISTVLSGAPLWVSLLGWWGRGDGLLALLGAMSLLLSAATLDRSGVERTITWLLGGATFTALIGVIQALGVAFPMQGMGGNVVGVMGNTNFAAGYFAICASLAVGRALTPGPVWQRVWAGLLAVVLAMLAVLTDAVQGPAAMAAGLVALGVVAAWLYVGRWRSYFLVAAGVIVLAGVVGLIGSIFAVGPLGGLWSQETFDIRQEYWQSAIAIMNGQPIVGTGPDSFGRYVSEYRPESYVELLGPVLRVSAAHNVALQFGATLGWLGLLLWVAVFVGTVVLLGIRIIRHRNLSLGVTAGLAGALTAYLVQGMVSIDMLPLLATGWTVAGLALALANGGHAVRQEAPPTPMGKRMVSAAKQRDSASTVTWTAGVLLGLGATAIVAMQIAAANAVQSVATAEEAFAAVTNPMTPCPLRVQLSQQILSQVQGPDAYDAVNQAIEVDRRCAPMTTFGAEIALAQSNLALAGELSESAVGTDPLSDLAWVQRGLYELQSGEIEAAKAALAEAERVAALYPEGSAAPEAIAQLRDAIAAGA